MVRSPWVVVVTSPWCRVSWWSCLSVCLSVCPDAYLKNHTFCACCIACGHGSLLWQHCSMMCTSSFVFMTLSFIFMFSHNGLCVAWRCWGRRTAVSCASHQSRHCHPCSMVLVASSSRRWQAPRLDKNLHASCARAESAMFHCLVDTVRGVWADGLNNYNFNSRVRTSMEFDMSQ